MRELRRWSLGVALTLVGGSSALAQVEIPVDNTGFGTTSGEFLLLGAGARSAALGGSYAAIATDASALYWNPAGVALNRRPTVEVAYLDYIEDTRYVWVGGVLPIGGGEWAVGVNLGSFGFDDQPIFTAADQENEAGRTYDVSETFAGLTIARQFSDRFSAGITGKLVSDVLGEVDGTAVAFDFGTNFHSELGGRPIRASFVIQHLGSRLEHSGAGTEVAIIPSDPRVPDRRVDPTPTRLRAKGWPLPVTFRVGVAYDVVSEATNRLTFLSEFTQPNNADATFNVAGEWGFDRIGGSGFGAALRASYSYQPDEEAIECTGDGAAQVCDFGTSFESSVNSDRGLDGLAFGGGLKWDFPSWSVRVDYALRHMGILETVNYFSIGLDIGAL